MAVTSSTIPIVIFFVLTIIYFTLQYKTKGNYDMPLFAAYIFVLLGSQLYINMQITSQLCGSTQARTAFVVTVFPWLIIFGLLNIVLALFPGWLIPFSNTFGYFIAKMAGLKKLLIDKILVKESEKAPNAKFSKTLGEIYDNPSLLINRIPNADEGFNTFWEKMTENNEILSNAANPIKAKAGDSKQQPSPKEQLRNLIRLKQIVAKFVWFALTGVLTATTSYTYIIRAGCSSTVKQMEQRHEEYERIVAKDEEDKQEPRVYVDHGD